MVKFGTISIIGVGLLGGAIAQACRYYGIANQIVGFGRNANNLKEAEEAKIVDSSFTDLESAVKNSDLVILCTPVGVLVERVKEMLPFLKEGCLITDVGSVKSSLVDQIDGLISDQIRFVGSHPIAGGEKTGWRASRKELLKNARCVVTPTTRTDPRALKEIRLFWEQLGMNVEEMDADEHDYIYGAVSHLPHVVAFTLMNTVGQSKTNNHDELLSLSAGGLRDITRIASSDPVMWRDICVNNKKHIIQLINDFQHELNTIKSYINNEDKETLKNSFQVAKEKRELLTKETG